MRVGASILFEAGICIQSYSWQETRPLGKLPSILQSMDEYECDEIAVIRKCRGSLLDNNYVSDLNILKGCEVASPLSFGGGIFYTSQLEEMRSLPVERFIFSSAAILGNTNLLKDAIRLFGRQAIQVLLPVTILNNELLVYVSRQKNMISFGQVDLEVLEPLCNEIILYDLGNEGSANNFDFSLVNKLAVKREKLVISGGIGPKTLVEARSRGIAAVLIENRVLHSESSIKAIKKNAVL